VVSAQPVHVALRDVTKTFQSKLGSIDALGPIDLELRQGEFFAVVGPSGCGKSTLLDIMAALAPPSSGTVIFEDRPIGTSVPDGVGVVFQENACFPWLNVADNITFGLRRQPIEQAEIERRAATDGPE
jgi:NitT/TauT family transport system ATP-binding protein